MKTETVGYKDLRLGQIVYILVFYNISLSFLLLDGFPFIFLLRDSENDLYMVTHSHYNYLHAIRDSISCRRERSIRYIMNTYLICESVSFFEIGAVQLRLVKRHRSEIIVFNRTEAIAGMVFKPAKKLCDIV